MSIRHYIQGAKRWEGTNKREGNRWKIVQKSDQISDAIVEPDDEGKVDTD